MPIPAQIPISYIDLRGKYEFRKRVVTLTCATSIIMVVVALLMPYLINMPSQPALTESVAVPSRTLASSVFPLCVALAVIALVVALIFTGLALHARSALRSLYPEQFRREH